MNHLEASRGAFSLQAMWPAAGKTLEVDPLKGGIRDEDLVGLCGVGDAGGDVDVNAQVVLPELARPAPVDPRPHVWPIAVDVDPPYALLTLKRRLDGGLGIEERRHQPVAEALHDPPLVRQDDLLDAEPHLTQQLKRGRVTSIKRPGREANQVGEEQRQLEVTPAAAHTLG